MSGSDEHAHRPVVETSGSTKLFLIGNGEAGIVLDVVGGQWNSFDIDLVAFAGDWELADRPDEVCGE